MRGTALRTTLVVIATVAVVVIAIVGSVSLSPYKTSTTTIVTIVTSTTTVPVGVTRTVVSNQTITVLIQAGSSPTTAALTSSTGSQQEDSSQESISCTTTGEGGPLYVAIFTDVGTPVANEQMTVVHDGPSVNGQSCGTRTLAPIFTNSTGWVEVPGGDGLPYAGSFVVSFAYSGQSFNATVPIEPVTTTFVTFYVPSGGVYTTNCELNNCPTYSNSMSMDG